MTWLPLVYQALQTSDVAALVDDRIYRHGEAPEAVEAPYVTWFLAAGTPRNALDEPPRVDEFIVQIDCWSNNAGGGDSEVEELATAVRDALEDEHHLIAVPFDGRDPETKRYRIAMQFTWFNHRGVPGSD